jgi:hypothetical protein
MSLLSFRQQGYWLVEGFELVAKVEAFIRKMNGKKPHWV